MDTKFDVYVAHYLSGQRVSLAIKRNSMEDDTKIEDYFVHADQIVELKHLGRVYMEGDYEAEEEFFYVSDFVIDSTW